VKSNYQLDIVSEETPKVGQVTQKKEYSVRDIEAMIGVINAEMMPKFSTQQSSRSVEGLRNTYTSSVCPEDPPEEGAHQRPRDTEIMVI